MKEKTKTYNPWPNGQVPEHLQRPELKQLKDLGYEFNDAREVIEIFEKKVARFAGSKYCITTDSCTSSIELSLRYLLHKGELHKWDTICIPKHTYISIYMLLKQLDFHVSFEDEEWSGLYRLKNTRIYDGAVRWKRGMYIGISALQCISFQIKKIIPIGKMGCVITDDKDAADFLRLVRYDGRDLTLPYDHENHIRMQGWHKYATPEDCARGIILMDSITQEGDSGNNTSYPDIQKMLKL